MEVQLSKTQIACVVAAFALVAGPALAQKGSGGSYPASETTRPLNLSAGLVEAGATIGIFTFPDDKGEPALGESMGLALVGSYGVNDDLQVGARIPVKLVGPDGTESIAGVWAHGQYALGSSLSARLDVGFVHVGAAGLIDTHPAIFVDGDGMKLAFAPGVIYKHSMGKLAIVASPTLLLQLDGAFGADGPEMLQMLMIPVGVWFQATTELALAVNTGILSAHEFKFGSDDGAAVPAYLTAQHTMMGGAMDLGVNVGLGNALPPEGADAGDTMFVGLFATYRP